MNLHLISSLAYQRFNLIQIRKLCTYTLVVCYLINLKTRYVSLFANKRFGLMALILIGPKTRKIKDNGHQRSHLFLIHLYLIRHYAIK